MFCCFLPCAAQLLSLPSKKVWVSGRSAEFVISFLPSFQAFYLIGHWSSIITNWTFSKLSFNTSSNLNEGYAMMPQSGHYKRLVKQGHLRNSWKWKMLPLFTDIFSDDVSKRGFLFLMWGPGESWAEICSKSVKVLVHTCCELVSAFRLPFCLYFVIVCGPAVIALYV